MPSDTCSKPIMYYRVSFKDNTDLVMSDLLSAAHRQLPRAKDREFQSGGQKLKGCKVRSQGDSHYVHITLVTPGQPASSVPENDDDATDVEVSLVYPSQNANFMDSDMFVMFCKNNVLFCSSGAKITKVSEYIKNIFEKTLQPEEYCNFVIQKIADIDKIRLIQQGIKEIHLGCALFPETLAYEQRKSVKGHIFDGMISSLLSLCAKDPKLATITEGENISAEIIFKYNRARKGGEIGRERMSSLSEQLLKVDDDGFKLTTFDGSIISAQDTMVKKKIKFTKFGKSVSYREVWSRMDEYYNELRDAGILEQ